MGVNASLIRGDALHIPLADASVDAIITSPPYFALRSYQDDGEHYDGQLGSEPTPAAFLTALWAVTDECWRVLKPTGSMFVDLGDSYAGSGGYNNSNIDKKGRGPKSYKKNGRGVSGQPEGAQWTPEDAAWLAGVIDSDGSISVREFTTASGGTSFVCWVRVGQMCPEVVHRCQELTGVGRVYQDKRGVWNWHIASQMARWVLEHIVPWLCIKRRQALGAIELQRHVTMVGATGKKPLTAEQVAYRSMIRQAVQGWNHRIECEWVPPEVDPPTFHGDWTLPKSLNGLPWAFAKGLTHPTPYRSAFEPGRRHPQWILRAEIVWNKPNGLPESVTDRVRRSHEQFFHFTKQGRYYAAVDEVREKQRDPESLRAIAGDMGRLRRGPSGVIRSQNVGATHPDGSPANAFAPNPLGKLPGSVWTVPSEPLTVPDHLGVDHFAAFPQEWPRRLILGWTPSGICVKCGEGRRPTTTTTVKSPAHSDGSIMGNRNGGPDERGWDGLPRFNREHSITGYACACDVPIAPTRPAVVLDPFVGTGTTPMVARMLGRYGIGLDLSRDYLRLATWRIWRSGHGRKAEARTNRERQGLLW